MSLQLIFMSECQTVLLKGFKGKEVVKTSKTYPYTPIVPLGTYKRRIAPTLIHIKGVHVIDI